MLFAELPWSDTVFLHSPDPGEILSSVEEKQGRVLTEEYAACRQDRKGRGKRVRWRHCEASQRPRQSAGLARDLVGSIRGAGSDRKGGVLFLRLRPAPRLETIHRAVGLPQQFVWIAVSRTVGPTQSHRQRDLARSKLDRPGHRRLQSLPLGFG